MRTALRTLICTLALMVPATASAVPIFVGSYAVFDGPFWGDNPAVYSAREAAAVVFGGLYTDYAISIDPSLDPLTITHTGWYDGWGEHQGMIFNEDYRLDLGNPGYNDPDGIVGAARSAYVRDGLPNTEVYRNYVWRDTRVPEPTSLLLFGSAGIVGLITRVRRRAKRERQ